MTGGHDGSVRLYHLLEQTPLRQWEPSPPPDEAEMDNPFAAISCVSFSHTRPSVFAVGSKDGYIYIYDLLVNLSGPLTTLRLPPIGINSGNLQEANHSGKKMTGNRPCVTGLAFNTKQRDLLSVCDSSGRVLIWKLGWNLSNQQPNELIYFEKLGNISVGSEGEGADSAGNGREDVDRVVGEGEGLGEGKNET